MHALKDRQQIFNEKIEVLYCRCQCNITREGWKLHSCRIAVLAARTSLHWILILSYELKTILHCTSKFFHVIWSYPNIIIFFNKINPYLDDVPDLRTGEDLWVPPLHPMLSIHAVHVGQAGPVAAGAVVVVDPSAVLPLEGSPPQLLRGWWHLCWHLPGREARFWLNVHQTERQLDRM